MKNFFSQMLTGQNGISSKRSVMVFFVLLFSFMSVYNMITGKAPNELYQEQVFEILIIAICTVFGERVVVSLSNMRKTKTDNSNQNTQP
jgi:hypothetical protein